MGAVRGVYLSLTPVFSHLFFYTFFILLFLYYLFLSCHKRLSSKTLNKPQRQMSSAATLNLVPVQLKKRGCSSLDLRTSSQQQLLVLSKPRRGNRSPFPLQGWYNRLQRDEVVAEWRKVQDKMSLHVHCHISGGHFLLDFLANLRYYIFCKELPVVLKAFVHGDIKLFQNHPELLEATVWVYFHAHIPEFNRVECWGPLEDAASRGQSDAAATATGGELPPTSLTVDLPRKCKAACDCCFPPYSLIPWPHDLQEEHRESAGQMQQL